MEEPVLARDLRPHGQARNFGTGRQLWRGTAGLLSDVSRNGPARNHHLGISHGRQFVGNGIFRVSRRHPPASRSCSRHSRRPGGLGDHREGLPGGRCTMRGASPGSHPSRKAGVPTVSVIIPSRNAAPYIRAAIDSALAQTHPVLEVLVIDGGSTDGTQDLVRSYGEPVRLLDERMNGGKGIGAARNVGVEAASGEWLAFLDADDWWDPCKIACQLAELAKHADAALNYTGVWMVDELTGKRSIRRPVEASATWPDL